MLRTRIRRTRGATNSLKSIQNRHNVANRYIPIQDKDATANTLRSESPKYTKNDEQTGTRTGYGKKNKTDNPRPTHPSRGTSKRQIEINSNVSNNIAHTKKNQTRTQQTKQRQEQNRKKPKGTRRTTLRRKTIRPLKRYNSL